MTIYLSWKVLLKWTAITCLCGAYSFVLGYSFPESFWPMVLGLATLILMFAFIESQPWYQAARGQNAVLARALDLGVKIRCGWAVFVLWSVFLIFNFIRSLGIPFLAWIVSLPNQLEVWIGVWAIWLTKVSIGIDMSPARGRTMDLGIDHSFAVYLTTITTGLAHTVILALLCGVIYLVLQVCSKKKGAVA